MFGTAPQCEDSHRPTPWEVADLHIREVLAIELKSRDKSLELQAAEYERRLEGLNHEAARISAAAEKAVSLEKFEGYVGLQETHNANTDRFIAKYNATVDQLRSDQNKLRNMTMTWLALVTAILAVVTILLKAWAI